VTRKRVLVRHERSDWSDWYVDKLSAEFPGFDFRAAHTPEETMELAPDTHVYIGIGPRMTPALVKAMPKLEWIQSLTTGVDNLLTMEEMPRGVPISKCVGVHGPQMSELALMFMLALARRLPVALENQREGKWERWAQSLLYRKTVCILGLGSIAETLAACCSVMGMTVTGVSDGRRQAPHVDRIYPRAALKEAVSEADFFVVLIPLTPETRHIVDAEIIGAMKPTAFLVNIARGGCVDEAALVEALESCAIAGAGIDVFETVPLPADHPLRQMPNVILTPHIGGYSDIYHEQCYPIVAENFRAFAEGGPDSLADAIRL